MSNESGDQQADLAHEADLELEEEQTTQVTGGRHRTLNYEHSSRANVREDRAGSLGPENT